VSYADTADAIGTIISTTPANTINAAETIVQPSAIMNVCRKNSTLATAAIGTVTASRSEWWHHIDADASIASIASGTVV
jgi:hypothetical protein